MKKPDLYLQTDNWPSSPSILLRSRSIPWLCYRVFRVPWSVSWHRAMFRHEKGQLGEGEPEGGRSVLHFEGSIKGFCLRANWATGEKPWPSLQLDCTNGHVFSTINNHLWRIWDIIFLPSICVASCGIWTCENVWSLCKLYCPTVSSTSSVELKRYSSQWVDKCLHDSIKILEFLLRVCTGWIKGSYFDAFYPFQDTRKSCGTCRWLNAM